MTAASVKECPEPTIRTGRPCCAAARTAPAASSVPLGVAVIRGRARYVSAHVRHNTFVMPREVTPEFTAGRGGVAPEPRSRVATLTRGVAETAPISWLHGFHEAL
ncbi:hypothetical protein GCM10009605_40150 [Nocardiopsis composta]